MLAGAAAQKFGQSLQQEQEILANIADAVNNVYAMESAILRTEKAIVNSGEEKNKQKLLYTQVFVQEAFQELEANAKETIVAIEEGDDLRILLSALKKLMRQIPVNVIKKKRQIAARVIEEEKYIV
ncbi:hypothetical protein ACVIJU_003420 [Aeribacillus sp. SP014]